MLHSRYMRRLLGTNVVERVPFEAFDTSLRDALWPNGKWVEVALETQSALAKINEWNRIEAGMCDQRGITPRLIYWLE